MLSILGYDGTTITLLKPTAIAGWLSQAGAKIWLDAQATTGEENAWLQQVFSLPQPRGEGWPNAAASLHPTPRFITGHLPLHPDHALDFYLGHTFLLTSHSQELPPLTQLWQTYQNDMSRWPYGLDYLLYQLLHHLTTLPTTTRQTYQEKLALGPEDQPDKSLLSLAHQLQRQKYHLQQAIRLVDPLSQLTHELLDANTNHQYAQLQQQLIAQVEEINLWQNGLALHQQQYQTQQNDQIQAQLRRLFWVILIGFLVCLLTLIVLTFTT